jgi:uncharacterized membrane protein
LVAALIPIVLGVVVWVVNQVVTAGLSDPYDPPSFMTTFLVSSAFGLVMQVLMAAASVPLMRMALAATRGQAVDMSMLTDTTNMGPAVITAVIYGIIVGIGTFLCVIPGIVAAVVLWPAKFVALEKGSSPPDALSEGFKLGSNGSVALGNFLAGLVAIAGILLCCVGIFVTYPLAMLASAHLYRSAKGEAVAA